MVAMSFSDRTRASLNLTPKSGAAFQGGMARPSATAAMSAARFSGLRVVLEGERADLALAMAFLTILLEDRGHILGEGRGGDGRGGFGDRTTDRGDVCDGDFLAIEDRRDRLSEFAAARDGVSNATRDELVVDPTVVPDLSLVIQYERFRCHGCADLPAKEPSLLCAIRNPSLKSRAWDLTSESLRSGSTQIPTHSTGFCRYLAISSWRVGL